MTAVAVCLVLLLAAAGSPAGPAPAAARLERHAFAGDAGSRDYLVASPPGGGRGRPVVVYLHGCSQTAAAAAEATRFAALGARERFVVVFPEQDPRANTSRCWNWFSPSHQSRDAGEPALIAGITRAVLAAEGADARRVYVAGLSAGGAMAVVMGATWPDLYAAVGVVAGCEYRGLPCILAPSAVPPETSARFAYEAMGPRARPVPVFVVQGDADRVVPPANAALVVRQWIETADLADDGADNDSVPTEPVARRAGDAAVAGGYGYEVAEWSGPDGRPLVERWLVAGLGHAYPTGGHDGPGADARGPDATAGAWRFFAEHPLPG